MNMTQKIESNLNALSQSVADDVAMNASARSIYTREIARISAHTATLAAMKIDCAALVKTEQTNSRIAVYAIQKFSRIIAALSQKSLLSLDKYTRATLANLNASDSALSNLSARASLCDTIKHDSALAVRLFKSDTTASTQRSSSAIALHAARVCDYSRDSKSLAFAEHANAKVMRDLLNA